MSKRDGRLPKVEKCEQCGRRMRRTIADRYEYRESGLTGVYLRGIAVYVCMCGEEVVELSNIDGLHDLIFQKLLMKSSSLKGSELRFIRQCLGLKAVDFAKMLSVTSTTVSRWENDTEPIGQANDKLIRLSVVLTVIARIKEGVEAAYREAGNRYLDFLGEIKNLNTKETAEQTAVDITRDELQHPTLTFRYGFVRSPALEVEFA